MTLLLGLGIVAFALLVVFLYWHISIAEGTYLGKRAVLYMYDRFADRYDGVKEWDDSDEAFFIGDPLTAILQDVNNPLVLDVATGTGRVPVALALTGRFGGRVIALDGARRMLRQAVDRSRDQMKVDWLHADATPLPFGDSSVDVVSCLEALEFLPDPRQALREMARVLRPGGVLLTSNRVGWRARLLPGRAMQREEMVAVLRSLDFSAVKVNPWQVDYDWVLARKTGKQSSIGNGYMAVADLLPDARQAEDGIWDLPNAK